MNFTSRRLDLGAAFGHNRVDASLWFPVASARGIRPCRPPRDVPDRWAGDRIGGGPDLRRARRAGCDRPERHQRRSAHDRHRHLPVWRAQRRGAARRAGRADERRRARSRRPHHGQRPVLQRQLHGQHAAESVPAGPQLRPHRGDHRVAPVGGSGRRLERRVDLRRIREQQLPDHPSEDGADRRRGSADRPAPRRRSAASQCQGARDDAESSGRIPGRLGLHQRDQPDRRVLVSVQRVQRAGFRPRRRAAGPDQPDRERLLLRPALRLGAPQHGAVQHEHQRPARHHRPRHVEQRRDRSGARRHSGVPVRRLPEHASLGLDDSGERTCASARAHQRGDAVAGGLQRGDGRPADHQCAHGRRDPARPRRPACRHDRELELGERVQHADTGGRADHGLPRAEQRSLHPRQGDRCGWSDGVHGLRELLGRLAR